MLLQELNNKTAESVEIQSHNRHTKMLGSVLLAPFVALLVMILSLASLGKSFGIRKAYVDLLLRLFEVSRWNNAQRRQWPMQWGRKSFCLRDQLRHTKSFKNRRKCVVIEVSRSKQAHMEGSSIITTRPRLTSWLIDKVQAVLQSLVIFPSQQKNIAFALSAKVQRSKLAPI